MEGGGPGCDQRKKSGGQCFDQREPDLICSGEEGEGEKSKGRKRYKGSKNKNIQSWRVGTGGDWCRISKGSVCV